MSQGSGFFKLGVNLSYMFSFIVDVYWLLWCHRVDPTATCTVFEISRCVNMTSAAIRDISDITCAWAQQYSCLSMAVTLIGRWSIIPCRSVDPGGWGVLTPWNYVGGVTVCFNTPKMSHFHTKLLLNSPASFRMYQKWKAKSISMRLQADGNRNCWVFGSHWRRV